jgi:hypothetical protein
VKRLVGEAVKTSGRFHPLASPSFRPFLAFAAPRPVGHTYPTKAKGACTGKHAASLKPIAGNKLPFQLARQIIKELRTEKKQ